LCHFLFPQIRCGGSILPWRTKTSIFLERDDKKASNFLQKALIGLKLKKRFCRRAFLIYGPIQTRFNWTVKDQNS
jgi:hypothetical protein